VQGPKTAALIAELFGGWIHELKYFWFRDTSLQGIPLLLARSGWSRQGGFELYLRDGARGRELWDIVKTAGASFDIGPGAPNDIERLESGLLSYGADARVQTQPANPFELGLGKLVNLDRDTDFIGKQALLKVRAEGVKRRLSGFVIDGDPVPGSQHPLPLRQGKREVGSVSEMAYSPRLQQNIGIGLVSNTVADDDANLTVAVDDKPRKTRLATLPFIR